MSDRKSIKNLMRSGNIPDLYVDTTHQDKETIEEFRRVDSDVFNPELMRYMKYKHNSLRPFTMVVAVDLHGQSKYLKYIYEHCDRTGGKAVFPGDIVTNANGVSSTNAQEERINARRELHALQVRNKELNGGKYTLFATSGNHDGYAYNRNRESNMDLASMFASSDSIPWAPYNVLLDVSMPAVVENKVEWGSCAGIVRHCSGGSPSIPGNVDVTLKQGELALSNSDFTRMIISYIFGGHYHGGSYSFMPNIVKKYDNDGRLVEQSEGQIFVLSGKTVQTPGDYEFMSNFKLGKPNIFCVEMSMVAVKNKNSKGHHLEPKFLVYNLFKESEKDSVIEFSNTAIKRQEYFGLDRKAMEEEVQKQTENKSLSEIQEMLESL